MKSTFPCELDIFGLHHHPVIQDEVTWPSFVAAALEACVLSTGWRGKHSEVVRSPLLLWPVSELVRRQRRSLKRAKKQPGATVCQRTRLVKREHMQNVTRERTQRQIQERLCEKKILLYIWILFLRSIAFISSLSRQIFGEKKTNCQAWRCANWKV